jgi:hypothetical protein
MVLCKVRGCQYSSTHVTVAHKCGKCGLFGHGKIECHNPEAIKILGNFYLDKIPKDKKCKISGCKYKDRHTTEGHVCHYCDKLGIKNHTQKCPKSGAKILDEPHFNQKVQAENSNIQPGFYIDIFAGMDNYWLARNNNGTLEYLFMHSDSWGQHGEETSDVPRLRAFKEDYEYQFIV